MNFSQAIRSGFTNYAQFGGFARRSEFWWWMLFIVASEYALRLIGGLVFGDFSGDDIISIVWMLGTVVPTLAVAVRRLRDAGFHWGFLFLLPLIVVGWIVLAVMLSRRGVTEAPPVYS